MEDLVKVNFLWKKMWCKKFIKLCYNLFFFKCYVFM